MEIFLELHLGLVHFVNHVVLNAWHGHIRHWGFFTFQERPSLIIILNFNCLLCWTQNLPYQGHDENVIVYEDSHTENKQSQWLREKQVV